MQYGAMAYHSGSFTSKALNPVSVFQGLVSLKSAHVQIAVNFVNSLASVTTAGECTEYFQIRGDGRAKGVETNDGKERVERRAPRSVRMMAGCLYRLGFFVSSNILCN